MEYFAHEVTGLIFTMGLSKYNIHILNQTFCPIISIITVSGIASEFCISNIENILWKNMAHYTDINQLCFTCTDGQKIATLLKF